MTARLRLCHIVDLERLGLRVVDAPAIGVLSRWAAAASSAGVDWIQLRGRGIDARGLARAASAMRASLEGGQTRLLVNDRADVALAAGAAGVHLPAAGLTVACARQVGAGWLVGRSAHDATELAAAAGADYVIVGTIFPTPSKPGHPGRGPRAIAEAVAFTRQPVLAIGGITTHRLPACRAAGAAGVAGIGLFGETPDALPPAVEALRIAWDTARA